MGAQPLISIAMPFHNAGKTLHRAVRSVIWQTYSEWELILIDDGSTDETGRIAAGFHDQRIKIISNGGRRGLAWSLNQALDVCHGEYFARLDADDLAYPERFQRQVEFLQQHREIDLLGTGAVVFGSDGSALGVFPLRQSHDEICRNPWSGFYLAHPTWMGRTEWFRKHRYRSEMRKAQDQDLLLRSWRTSCFACLPEILTGYAQESLSLKKILVTRYYLSIALVQAAARRGQYFSGMHALMTQLAKGMVDAFSILTGLERFILRHRALPISAQERERWTKYLSSCAKETNK
jgi:glycosyltransferase involved in cell wall biosynthesis